MSQPINYILEINFDSCSMKNNLLKFIMIQQKIQLYHANEQKKKNQLLTSQNVSNCVIYGRNSSNDVIANNK